MRRHRLRLYHHIRMQYCNFCDMSAKWLSLLATFRRALLPHSSFIRPQCVDVNSTHSVLPPTPATREQAATIGIYTHTKQPYEMQQQIAAPELLATHSPISSI